MREWPQVDTEIGLNSGIFVFNYGISPASRRAYVAEFNQLDMTMDLCLDLCRATDRFRIGMRVGRARRLATGIIDGATRSQ
jgi:hypothetical protein